MILPSIELSVIRAGFFLTKPSVKSREENKKTVGVFLDEVSREKRKTEKTIKKNFTVFLKFYPNRQRNYDVYLPPEIETVDRIRRRFKVALKCKFSTPSAPASRQQSGSVWSLSDTEVEKREWTREQLASYDRDEMPCASSFNDLLRQQRISSTARKPLEGEDDLEEVANEDFDDEWSIRASMGLDRTLDDEAEEDEYDKVALGEENGDEGLSMKDALSESSGGRVRDPRANHIAAKNRLKEDEIEASKFSASGSGDHPSKSKPPHSEESTKAVPPKPILKRKESSSDSEARTSKRVRFDVVSEETSKKPGDTCSASASVKIVLQQGKSGAQVPDYLVNPSKYTRYSFDPSCELKEKSPTTEDMDSPKAVEGLETSESGSFKKVSFIPQKKTKDVREDSSNCGETKPLVAGQVAEDLMPSATGDEDTEIGESDSCTSFKSKGRQYRARRSLDEADV